ncbi:hypothetical protein BSKO_09421 [Bryopsis sp. KO-2023]|nr:hypothetical protein BSKO_09421 [Bryopsis sp. KO-2023]
MGEPDSLWNLRNFFYLGAYQSAINEGQDLADLSDGESLERDFFVYRSYVALGQSELVMSEIGDASPLGLIAVKTFAKYLTDRSQKDSILATLTEWMGDPVASANPYVCIIAGTIFSKEENFVEALKACHAGTNLEMMALCVQVYLHMNRGDKAEAQVKAMSKIDDDSTMTQLAMAWVNISLGGEKVQEAFYIFQELGDKFNWTSMLHNGSGICNLKMGRYEEAERDLLDALNKDAQDANALANIITCQFHLGKAVSRYASQLKMIDPEHALVKLTTSAEEAFQRAAAAFA